MIWPQSKRAPPTTLAKQESRSRNRSRNRDPTGQLGSGYPESRVEERPRGRGTPGSGERISKLQRRKSRRSWAGWAAVRGRVHEVR